MKCLPASLILLACLPGATLAQDHGWGAQLVPRIGYFHADKAMGYLAPGQQGSPLAALENSLTVGLAAHIDSPWRWIGARLLAEQTVGSDLVDRQFSGWSDCGHHCLAANHDSQPLSSGTSDLNLMTCS